MNRTTKNEIIIIVLLTIVLAIAVTITVKEMNNIGFDDRRQMGQYGMGMPVEEEVVRDTKMEDVKADKTTSENNINLSEMSENLSIDKAGEYNLTGEFAHTLLIDADGEVILNLDNVTIKNDITSTIVNRTKNPLVINLVDGTVNNLTDGGSSDYNSCIYSNGPLTIKGNGTLNVYGRQEEDEGIATDENDITIESGNINIECTDDGINAGGDNGGVITINGGNIFVKASGDGIDSNKDFIMNGGYLYTIGSALGGNAAIDTDGAFEINGGTIIAIGSDMLQKPDDVSKQKSIALSFNENMENGSKMTLKDSLGNEVISFDVKENFRTLILSDEKIIAGNYTLYKNGEKLEEITVK